MSRIPLVVGNWKMHKTIQETVDFCRLLREELSSWPEGPVLREKKVEVAVAPPFTNLSAAAQALQGSFVEVSSQDVFWAESGAYTGEVSPGMLIGAGCRFAIVGHSERRQYFHETDPSVNKKAVRYRGRALAALAALIVAALTTLIVPVAVRRMIDFGFSDKAVQLIDSYFAVMIMIVAVLAISSALRYYLVTTLGAQPPGAALCLPSW